MIIRSLLILLIVSVSLEARAQFFVEGDLGFARYRSDSLQALGVTPGGLNLALSAGYVFIPYLGAEAFYGSMKTKTSIMHDYLMQYIHYDNTYYGVGIRAVLSSIQIRLGYAFHSITPYNTNYPDGEEPLNNTTTAFYNTDNQKFSSSGVYYGFVVEAFEISPTMNLGIGSMLYTLSEPGSNFFSFTLALRYSFGAKKSGGN